MRLGVGQRFGAGGIQSIRDLVERFADLVKIKQK